MFDLSTRAAVVTGGTGNLGPAVVRAYLVLGAHVAIAVRDLAKGEAVRAALGDLAGTAEDPRLLVIKADPADAAGMRAAVEQVLRAWGRLDVLANLAGGFSSGSPTDLAAMQASWDMNVSTAVTATAACLPPMRARGYGRIVSVSSVAALKGGKNAAGYAMSKGALLRWTESLAADVKADGVTANVIVPTTMDHPVNRAAMPKADPKLWPSPEEVAAVIAFLSSEESSGVTGAAIPVLART